jgi:hypothetical protein
MRWNYKRLAAVEDEINAFVDDRSKPGPLRRTDDEIKALNFIEQASKELIEKIKQYNGYGPDPRDEFTPATRIGSAIEDLYYLHHKGFFVYIYRDVLNTSAVLTGFVYAERTIRGYVFGRFAG